MAHHLDEKWIEDIALRVYDIKRYLVPIKGFSDLLEIYLRALKNHEIMSITPAEAHQTVMTLQEATTQFTGLFMDLRGKAMTESMDKEKIAEFLHDMANYLVPLKAWSQFLEAYLEALLQQENVPCVRLSDVEGAKEMRPEDALKIIRIIRANAESLFELKNHMRDDIGLN